MLLIIYPDGQSFFNFTYEDRPIKPYVFFIKGNTILEKQTKTIRGGMISS